MLLNLIYLVTGSDDFLNKLKVERKRAAIDLIYEVNSLPTELFV